MSILSISGNEIRTIKSLNKLGWAKLENVSMERNNINECKIERIKLRKRGSPMIFGSNGDGSIMMQDMNMVVKS